MEEKEKTKISRNKIIILVIVVTTLILIICVASCLFYSIKMLKVNLDKDRVVEINSEVYNTDYIKSIINGTIVSDKQLVDTSVLGKKKVILKIKDYFNKIKSYTYDIEIIDTIEPNIEYNERLSTTIGNEINLLEGIIVSDNSNEEIKVTVEGEHDFNIEGMYKLYYVAKDSSGNERKEAFVLEVTGKEEVISASFNNVSYFTTSKGFKGYTKNGITYIEGVLIVNKTYSIPSSYYPGDLTSEVKDNMNNMFADAASIGLNIYLSSGFRSYNTQ